MMVTNLKFHNKHLSAKSNINKDNKNIYSIYETKLKTIKRVKPKTTVEDTEKYSVKELAPTLLEKSSAVTLPNYFLPKLADTAHLSCCIKNGTENRNSNVHNESCSFKNTNGSISYCVNSTVSIRRTNCCKKKKMKKDKDSSQLNQRESYMPVAVGQLYACKNSNSSTHFTTISRAYRDTLCSTSFKFRHRKTRTSKTLATKTSKADSLSYKNETLQHRDNRSVAVRILTPVPLMKSVIQPGTARKVKFPAASSSRSFRFRSFSGLKVTSLFSLLTLICLETVLLSTVSNCAKTFYMHWNTSNSIFRIDNTDHIIDVNKGNLAFEFDQVHIICPVYEPGTFENETEKYIIYNVSKVEYETCRITNADPRVIAICDKPQKLMFFTITFRPFTPQPGGLEFLPGNDYYFISTSSKDDLYRRIGGRCSTNNMKVVFKVCCTPENKSNETLTGGGRRNPVGNGSASDSGVIDSVNNVGANGNGGTNFGNIGTVNQQHINSISTGLHRGGININNSGGLQQKTQSESASGTSINTNIDHYNRISTHTNGVIGISNGIGSVGLGSHGVLLPAGSDQSVGGVLSGGGAVGVGGQYIGHHQTGIRINNVPTSQHYPSNKNSNGDDHYNKHPNEVVKNEELTYTSASSTLHNRCKWKIMPHLYNLSYIGTVWTSVKSLSSGIFENTHLRKLTILVDKLPLTFRNFFPFRISPILIISVFIVTCSTNVFKFNLRTRSEKISSLKFSLT